MPGELDKELEELQAREQDFEIANHDLEVELQRMRDQQARIAAEIAAVHTKQREMLMQKQAIVQTRAAVEEKVRLQKEQETENEFRVTDFNGFFVNVKIMPEPRSDVLKILRQTYGRQYDHYAGINRIPIDVYEELKKAILDLPRTKFTHVLGVEGKIKAYFNKPEFEITLEKRSLRVACHERATTGQFSGLPGYDWDAERRVFRVPISEGWRLLPLFEGYTRAGQSRKIVWEPQALELVQEEIKRRDTLDKVALQEDCPRVHELVKFARGQRLHPFQAVGVEFIDLAKGRALCADQMGLGKTWEAIAYALLNELKMTIVVCPAHLKANWAREITMLTGVMPTLLFGREPKPWDIATLLKERPRFVIINYDIIGAKTRQEAEIVEENGELKSKPARDRFLWAELINMAKPDYIILDEAHYIKNTESNRSRACLSLDPPYRLPMTGTPVLNRPGEFYPALHWIAPQLFPNEGHFLEKYTSGGKGAKNVTQLRELLRPLMIRRLKKDVVKELPPLNRIERMHELSAEGRERYKEVLDGVYRVIDMFGNEVQKNITSILAEIGKLKEVCSFDKVEAVVDLASELISSEEDEINGQGKVLIFSQYKRTVRQIAARLGSQCIHWTGDTPFDERTRLEGEFQNNPDVKYLVVSLMTGQTGLNLTAAGHVIFADLYWTPAAHAQAEERAYGRLSDLHGADSYYLIAGNTIETWIWDLLAEKIAVINEVVEGIADERTESSIGMEIIRMLQEQRETLTRVA